MKGVIILIAIVLFFWLVIPALFRWMQRRTLRKVEKLFRQAMGMPPHSNESSGKRKRRGYERPKPHEPIIPKEYAEDVEFTETIDYSHEEKTEVHISTDQYHESQISDAEWTEIKSGRSK